MNGSGWLQSAAESEASANGSLLSQILVQIN